MNGKVNFKKSDKPAFGVRPMPPNWLNIISIVKTRPEIRASICKPCLKGKLYDKNGESYLITSKTTVEELDDIINTINSKKL